LFAESAGRSKIEKGKKSAREEERGNEKIGPVTGRAATAQAVNIGEGEPKHVRGGCRSKPRGPARPRQGREKESPREGTTNLTPLEKKQKRKCSSVSGLGGEKGGGKADVAGRKKKTCWMKGEVNDPQKCHCKREEGGRPDTPDTCDVRLHHIVKRDRRAFLGGKRRIKKNTKKIACTKEENLAGEGRTLNRQHGQLLRRYYVPKDSEEKRGGKIKSLRKERTVRERRPRGNCSGPEKVIPPA